MWTVAPLFLAPCATLLLRRGGHRGVAWILPGALALLWCVARGHGRRPEVLGAAALLFGAALLLGVRRLRRSAGEPQPAEEARDVVVPRTAVFAGDAPPPRAWTRMLESRSQAPVYPFDAAAGRAARRGTGPTNGGRRELAAAGARVATAQDTTAKGTASANGASSAAASGSPHAVAREGAAAPPSKSPAREEKETAPRIRLVRGGTLVDALVSAATPAQSEWLPAALARPDERTRLLEDAASGDDAVVPAPGVGQRTDGGPWGASSVPGAFVHFEGRAPGDTTLLAVRVDLASAAGGMSSTVLLLVPTDLAAVKRLDPRSAPRARWVARAAFVPEHLFIGGPGAGASALDHLT
ncbi:MAG: hypothetical protein AAFP22_13745 [Planctomycetota bacterium]